MATRYRKVRKGRRRTGKRRTLRRGGRTILEGTNPMGTGERAMELVNKLTRGGSYPTGHGTAFLTTSDENKLSKALAGLSIKRVNQNTKSS